MIVIDITEAAIEQLSEVKAAKGKAGALRIFVKGGGCGGLAYGMTFDENRRDGDEEFEVYGFPCVMDAVSKYHMQGASIDFRKTIMGSGFNIENPNAAQLQCGCGSSGSVCR